MKPSLVGEDKSLTFITYYSKMVSENKIPNN